MGRHDGAQRATWTWGASRSPGRDHVQKNDCRRTRFARNETSPRGCTSAWQLRRDDFDRSAAERLSTGVEMPSPTREGASRAMESDACRLRRSTFRRSRRALGHDGPVGAASRGQSPNHESRASALDVRELSHRFRRRFRRGAALLRASRSGGFSRLSPWLDVFARSDFLRFARRPRSACA
ncbi:hypothetical protein DB32_000402 [Sandaracinus amylolyticus]|uniref:Uncharacterized protein n=1 Tax=Sandaracinus amylolyticus TaxID=927083 RepID=A0A0F6YGU1_9BACT|nr:hypothetical protein DB32_000402 [Sandaracinus amylolyticus]